MCIWIYQVYFVSKELQRQIIKFGIICFIIKLQINNITQIICLKKAS